MFYFSEFLEDLFTLSPILLDRTEALGLQNLLLNSKQHVLPYSVIMRRRREKNLLSLKILFHWKSHGHHIASLFRNVNLLLRCFMASNNPKPVKTEFVLFLLSPWLRSFLFAILVNLPSQYLLQDFPPFLVLCFRKKKWIKQAQLDKLALPTVQEQTQAGRETRWIKITKLLTWSRLDVKA